jgi:Ca2+-binding EF-hand superfamily protein
MTNKGECTIPPNLWLVLQPCSTLNKYGFAGRSLAEAAWPQLGQIAIPDDVATLLQPVRPESLNILTANANLKRANKGSNFLVRRHAAYIKKILPQRVATGIEIVEAVTEVSLSTWRGDFFLAPLQWIALQPVGFGGRALSDAAWPELGACIQKKCGSLVRLVPEERLNAVAAEANFKRASHSTSMQALRHAIYAMELLQDRTREGAVCGANSPVLSSPTPSPQLENAISVRFGRVAPLVQHARLAAKSRLEDNSLISGQLSQRVLAAPSQHLNNLASRLLRSNRLLQKGVQALDDFYDFVNRRFGNNVRAWFHLDIEENMKIGEKVFVRRCLDIGYRGNVIAMYRYIDSDRSGSVSLLELDASASSILAGFKMFMVARFQGDPDKLFQFLDHNRSGRLGKDDVVHGLEKAGYDGPVEELFDFLDREGFGHVVPSDLKYLKNWKPRPYLFAKPDFDALAVLKESFEQVNGPPLFKTWRHFLDRDGCIRVSLEDFVSVCRKHTRHAVAKGFTQALPTGTEEEIATVWRALDDDCSGWIALKEFDVTCFKVLKRFKGWAQQEFGGVVIALKKLDDNANAKLSHWELRKSGFPGDVDAVFEYLDLDKQKSLGEAEVKFLDGWDLAWEEYEEKARSRRKTTTLSRSTLLSEKAVDSKRSVMSACM